MEGAREERMERKRALLQEEERLRNKLEVRRIIFTEIIASEASFLVSSMAQIFAIYNIYMSDRPSFRKCSKCFCAYLNIRAMRYSFFAMQI